VSLADLNSLAEQGIDISTGVVESSSSAQPNPQEVPWPSYTVSITMKAVGKKEAQKGTASAAGK